MKARCPVCGQERRARQPKGGDGSAVIVMRHLATHYDHMQGERVREDCRGSYSLVAAAPPAEPPTPEDGER